MKGKTSGKLGMRFSGRIQDKILKSENGFYVSLLNKLYFLLILCYDAVFALEGKCEFIRCSIEHHPLISDLF